MIFQTLCRVRFRSCRRRLSIAIFPLRVRCLYPSCCNVDGARSRFWLFLGHFSVRHFLARYFAVCGSEPVFGGIWRPLGANSPLERDAIKTSIKEVVCESNTFIS